MFNTNKIGKFVIQSAGSEQIIL